MAQYHTATVRGSKVFYREAGDQLRRLSFCSTGSPAVARCTGISFLYSPKFHVIAPDYIGFGHSDAPSNTEFAYTFGNLAVHVRGLIHQLGLSSYILYMQDYGGPVGFRLFTERPEEVKGFVIQNTNAYMGGVGDPPKEALMPFMARA